jgi:hypothetical protein
MAFWLPEDYVAVSLFPDESGARLKVCLVVRPKADPLAGHWVVLRTLFDAWVYLGCLADAGGGIHEWLEIWVQQPGSRIGPVPGCRAPLSNAVLDGRWARHVAALRDLDQAELILTGAETAPPRPTLLDLEGPCTFHPVDAPSGQPFTICQDEVLLQAKGLPGYATTPHRYLCVPSLGGDSPFVPASPDAPAGGATRNLAEVLGPKTRWVPFNPWAGMMLVRKLAPWPYDTLVDLLAGVPQESLRARPAMPPLDRGWGIDPAGPGSESPGFLFLGSQGRQGRLLEGLHLRLRLLSSVFAGVRSLVYHHQRPLLNLTNNSFRIRLGHPARGLPFLWTADAVVVDPGGAVTLPIENTDSEYFLPAGDPDLSVYRSEQASLHARGEASVRIRQVKTGPPEMVAIEGTFFTHERFRATSRDIVVLHLSLAGEPVDLYAHLHADSALAAGERRFVSIPQRRTELKALLSAEGVFITGVPFVVLPLLSTPCDLYSLAVLTVRTLLVNSEAPLPVALDETLSLARQVQVQYVEDQELPSRIRTIFEKDDRWQKSLGPHRLTSEPVGPGEMLDIVPADLWCEVLAMVVRLFPGIGPDSHCSDWGHAQPGGLHKVFDAAIGDLDSLVAKTRSLIVLDWKANREIHAAIRQCLSGLDPKA